MNKEQKDNIEEKFKNTLALFRAEGIEWVAFVIKTKTVRIAVSSEGAPKSTRLA